VGALIGSWGQRELESLVVFGSFLGTAFQIADDLLNLTPSASRYGKEPLGDIREGKRTLMLVHLLQEAGSADHRFLVDFLADDSGPRADEDIRAVYDLMLFHGSLDFARRFGQGIADAARGQFDEAFGDLPPSDDRQFLWDIIGWMLEREH